jgi:DNA-binding transcriptional LysR family regulator
MNGTTDPSLLALFAEVVAAGGVRGAAQRTGLPRSTVSRRLAALEGQLDVRLLQRTTRTVTLTEEGEFLLAQVRGPLAALAEAEGALRARKGSPAGTLRVSAPGLFAEAFLGPVLARYTALYPAVRVELVLADRMVSLVDERFDCAIRAGPLGDSTLVARRLGYGTQRLVAAPSYLRARPAPKRPRDLAAHDVVVFSGRRQPERWVFTARGKKVAVTVSPRLRANSYPLVRDLACAGQGVALLPTFLVADDLRRGALVELLPEHASPRGAVYAVHPSDRHLAPRTRAFLDLLAEHFDAHGLDGER